MKSNKLFIATFIATALTLVGSIESVAAETSRTEVASPVQVMGRTFGLFSTPPDGQAQFAPGLVVPLVEGQGYGWVMNIQTSKKQVQWREEFTLPTPPKTWGDPEPLGKRQLSADAKVSNTERVVEPVGGLIFNAWAVAKGDPAGKYKIRVFVEGRLAATFEFELR